MPPQIKGAFLINTMAIVREVLGTTRYQQVLQACPAETQQQLKRTLVAVEWVSMALWSPFLQAVFENGCRKDEQLYRRLLRAICKRDFSTVYRAYLNNATPDSILNKLPNIWSAYFDTGTMAHVSSEPEGDKTRATVQMRDLETSLPLYAVTMQAYLEQLVLLAGGRQCTVQRVRERLHGSKLSCDYLIEYSP